MGIISYSLLTSLLFFPSPSISSKCENIAPDVFLFYFSFLWLMKPSWVLSNGIYINMCLLGKYCYY